MAVDLMTLAGVAQVAEEGQRSFNMLMALEHLDTDNLVQQAINHIQEKIEQLEGKEQEFLSMFDCSSTEAFKSRVANYYYYNNLIEFTGANLKSIVEEFKSATNEKIKERARTIEVMISNLIQSDLVKDAPWDLAKAFQNGQVTNEIANYVTNKIIDALSGKGLGGGGILVSTDFGSSKKKDDGSEIFEIAANLTTKAFDEHLHDLQSKVDKKLTGLTKNSDEYQAIKTARILLKETKNNSTINGLRMEQSFGVQWSDLISKATKGGTGKGLDINVSEEELKKINDQIADNILNRLNLDATMHTFAKGRIYDMLNKDPKMFFVGHSYTQLEGILGEINSVIAIVGLLGEKYRPRAMQWIGSQMGKYSKKQPSIDIVLREIGGVQFGVQIKNTASTLTEDVSHYISFADKSIDEIFNALSGSEAIKDVYIADVFNVPYKRKGNEYKQVGYNTRWEHNDPAAEGFQTYVEIDKQIDEIVTQMNMYLTRFAPDFLYMGLGNDFRSRLATLDNEVIQTGGNFVYIVGPNVFFAKEMLQKLKKQLEVLTDLKKASEQTSFRLEAYFGKLKGETGKFNIVSALNGRGDLASHTIKMRSSWGF